MSGILDQSFTTTPDDAGFLRYSTSVYNLAQQITPSVTGYLVEFHLKCTKIGSPTGNMWVELWSDTGSDLPNSIIGTASDTLDVSTISASETEYTFSFSTTDAAVTASTKYWVVFLGDYTVSTSNYIQVGRVTAGGYSGGITAYSDNASNWTPQTNDYYFKQYRNAPSASGFLALL